VLLEQVGKSLIRQFLKGPHPVARKLGELVEGVLVEGDQFAQTRSTPAVERMSHAMIYAGDCSAQEQGQGAVVDSAKEISMKIASAIFAIAILISPVPSFAQSAGGSSSSGGSGSAAGSPSAGSAGAGTSGISGVPPGPASPGGANNAGEDPSGAGNASRLASPPAPGTNSAGTAQSSGGGITTGSAASNRASGDAAITEENKTIDRKLKSICRGC
jgi:hypothetical protein